MRFANYLVHRPSGFAFRLIVPFDLRPVVGRRVIKKALGTHDRVSAQAIALGLAAQYALAFRQLRGQQGAAMSGKRPPSVAELVHGFHAGENEVYHLDIAKGIVSNDDADHERAMEALEKLQKTWQPPVVPPSPASAVQARSGFGIALGAAIRSYGAIEAPGLKPDTWDGRQRALKTFTAFFGEYVSVDTITRPQVARRPQRRAEPTTPAPPVLSPDHRRTGRLLGLVLLLALLLLLGLHLLRIVLHMYGCLLAALGERGLDGLHHIDLCQLLERGVELPLDSPCPACVVTQDDVVDALHA